MSFKRINGHIVHIRDKNEEGGIAVAGGVATGIVSGRHAAVTMHEAALAENAARGHEAIAKSLKSAGPLFDSATKQARAHANRAAKESYKKSLLLEKHAFKVRGAGIAASAGLLTAGIDRLMGNKNEQNKKTRATSVAVVSGAAAFGVHSIYSHGVGLRGVKKFTHAFKRAMKI